MRWVIYSTFDAKGLIPSPAIEQVRAYRDVGSSVLVVDTSPIISDDRAHAWTELATAWVQRNNVGYDFTSYRVGLDWLRAKKIADSCSLLLTNDSCYGPFLPLQPIFERFDQDTSASVFGITDSYYITHHLQSYWLYFPAARVSELMQFFANMGEIQCREQAIQKGEIALSVYFRDRAITLNAWCPTHRLIKYLVPFPKASLLELRLRKLLKSPKYNQHLDDICFEYLVGDQRAIPAFNPTLRAAAELYKYQLSPFVKRQFFRDGYYKPNVQLTPNTNIEVSALLSRRCWR
jgi:lipopolysaccharide biosynthesis protein